MPRLRRPRGRPRSEVITLFSRWLDANERDRAWAADQLGVSRSYVDRLARGSSMPSLDLALKIERLTGGAITPAMWSQRRPASSHR